MDQIKRVEKLLEKILFIEPLLGHVISRWERITLSNIIQTAATSRDTLLINPEFLSKLTDEEALGVILHEVFHQVYMHPFILDKNITICKTLAMEHVVNESVLNFAKYYGLRVKLPGSPVKILDAIQKSFENGYIYDPDFFEKDTSEIMKMIEKYCKNEKEMIMVAKSCSNESSCENSCDQSNVNEKYQKVLAGDVIVDDGSSSENSEKKLDKSLEKSTSIMILENLKKKGILPGSAERFLKSLKEPIVDWKRVLYKYLKMIFENEVSKSYSKNRGRNQLTNNFILPSVTELKRKPKGNVVVAVDTSGSISEEELNRFLSEVFSILKTVTDKVRIISCDSKVHDDITVTIKDLPRIKIRGGGDTDFRPVFDLLEREKNRITDALIYFTDGCGDFPEKDPKFPTIFAINNQDVDIPKNLKRCKVVRVISN